MGTGVWLVTMELSALFSEFNLSYLHTQLETTINYYDKCSNFPMILSLEIQQSLQSLKSVLFEQKFLLSLVVKVMTFAQIKK